MRIPRFTIGQLLLVVSFVGLCAGLFASARRETRDDGACHFCFSPSGMRLAVLHGNGRVRVWDVEGARPRLVAEEFGERPRNVFEIEGMNFVDDNRIVKVECTVNRGATRVRELDLQTGRISEILECRAILAYPQIGQASSATRFIIADFTTGDLQFYDLVKKTLEKRIPFSAPNSWPSMLLSGNGEILAANDHDGTVHVLDPSTANVLLRLPSATGSIGYRTPNNLLPVVELNHDGTLLAVTRPTAVDAASEVQLYDPRTGAEMGKLPHGLYDVWGISFSGDGRQVAISDGQVVECYELATKRLTRRVDFSWSHQEAYKNITAPRLKVQYGHIALSRDGARLAAASQLFSDQIMVWDFSRGSSPVVIGGSDFRAASVAVFTLGFAGWAVAWGMVRRKRRGSAGISPNGLFRPTPVQKKLLLAGCWLTVGVILVVRLYATKRSWAGELNLLLGAFSEYFTGWHIAGLMLLPCMFLLLCMRRIRSAEGVRPALPQQTRTPWGLRICWTLMFVGGLWALLIPIGVLFFGRTSPGWTNYLSFVVGMLVVGRAASGDARRVHGGVGLQATNIIACDGLNVLLAVIEYSILRLPRVRRFVQAAQSTEDRVRQSGSQD